ncbi:uncharacterized protein LOC114747192 [Neltuma alba]|uniref:uncharacterized protein LOC114747192 n=1 Tax=Neltuma alba TaxID=207710 RepID=UPI0010A47A05|nr:uncharacterized protein LOC114747192 [Prosopis alba]
MAAQVDDKVMISVVEYAQLKSTTLSMGAPVSVIATAGPFEILSQVGPVAYRLTLSPNLSQLHNIFHIFRLKKYHLDPDHVMEPDQIELKDNLSIEVRPEQIVDQKVKQLRNKAILLIKMIWKDANFEEATREKEDKMRSKYPKLFT